jgi:hypothetical protein
MRLPRTPSGNTVSSAVRSASSTRSAVSMRYSLRIMLLGAIRVGALHAPRSLSHCTMAMVRGLTQ